MIFQNFNTSSRIRMTQKKKNNKFKKLFFFNTKIFSYSKILFKTNSINFPKFIYVDR